MDSLTSFRRTHPEQHAWLGLSPWSYVAGGSGLQGLLVLGGGLSFGDSSHRLVTGFEGDRKAVSPSYPRVASVQAVLEGLVRLLDREQLQKVDVFGHSLGAGVAHAFVRRYPQRVDRLALSSFGLYTRGHLLAVRAFTAAARVLPYSALRAYYRRVLERSAREASPEMAAQLRALTEEVFARHTHASALAQLGLLDDLFRHRSEYRLDEPCERPGRVLLLLANDDRGFNRAEQDALVASYPGAVVSRFVSGGHLIGFTRADEVEHKLSLFFRRRVAAPALPRASSPPV